jgi:hypothetical protein
MGKRPQSISGLTCSIITRELKYFAYIFSHRLFRILSKLQSTNNSNIYNELSTIDTLHNTYSITSLAELTIETAVIVLMNSLISESWGTSEAGGQTTWTTTGNILHLFIGYPQSVL